MGSFQVQRRVAGLLWIGIAVYRDCPSATGHVRRLADERRRAKLKPPVVAEFDTKGTELTDESRRASG